MNQPLVVILGETASGKSALALRLAQQYNGEIICADSRTVYQEMDIGTAKPSIADQQLVRHYGLDLIASDERYSVAQFKAYATKTMADIHRRGKLPFLVGGTGLYIDAVLYDFSFGPPADPVLRQQLSLLTVAELQATIRSQGLRMPVNLQNPRHLIRTIEMQGRTPTAQQLRAQTLVLGMTAEREVLKARIAARTAEMLRNGFVDEARYLVNKYGPDAPGLQAPGYRAFRNYLDGTMQLADAEAAFIKNDLDLAKRQRTWFRRNKSIHWLPTGKEYAEAVDVITTLLNT